MRMRLITILAAALGGGTFWSSEMASAAEIKVLSSQAIKEAYLALVGDAFDPAEPEATFLAKAHSALHGIEILRPLCEPRTLAAGYMTPRAQVNTVA